MTLLEGRGPESAWTAVPVLAGLVLLLAMPFSLRLALWGMAALTGTIGVALLVVPDQYLGGPGRLTPGSVTEARIMGVGLLVLLGAAAVGWRSDRRWRRLVEESEARGHVSSPDS